ncbi:NAD-dependent protein deacylase [Salimicrobium halophilum]|uniref:protein acetyllysine N-acetyltransferase n=1 Tax=Salimicrobium halophilum TaxID=86666 RepID=A0A1G8RLL4_9BACI|nr:NAD-dependent protein deacylase [Salimicrobium halophilum]SDJ17974.1 NAD-dependent deacetylase [Salimicrobium halophilum]
MLDTIKDILSSADHVVALTGAGVSTASGIPDFRSSEGLWSEDKSREELMSRDFFDQNPEEFWHHYKSIFKLKLLQNYGPNAVHRFLLDLEKKGKRVDVVTQNVDGLHTAAGNGNVLEYHGTLKTATCPDCYKTYPLEKILSEDVPTCTCGSIPKPDVVLFGDMIQYHEEAERLVRKADVTLVLGTSLSVMPFNMLPMAAGGVKILINNQPTDKDYMFDYYIHDDLSEVVAYLNRKE